MGLDEGDNNLGLEEGGLIFHEDGRKRKASKLLGNNLDTNNIMADTLTLISLAGIQDEVAPVFSSASPARQAHHQLELPGPQEPSVSLGTR